MSAGIALALVGGGAVVAATSKGGTPSQTTPTMLAPNGGALIPTGAASSGSTIGTLISQPLSPVGGGNARLAKLAMVNRGSAATGVVGVSPTAGWGSQVSPTNGIDAALQQKLDEISAYTEAAYNKLSEDAKEVGAAKLSEELKLDPPIDGKKSWKEVSAIAGAAVGGAVGAWLGGPLGAKLGAILGAYLGTKLEELISKNVDEIKAWFKDKWSDIEDWVKGIGNDIEDGAEAVIDYIGGIF